jgi:hypothetical protein
MESVLCFAVFSLLGWLAADAFLCRRRIRQLQAMIDGMAARIVAQSELLSKKAEKPAGVILDHPDIINGTIVCRDEKTGFYHKAGS